MKLTKRQKEVLDFLSEFIDQNGYSPSMEEIATHFHFASLNAVFKHLGALESRGHLQRDSNRARSIQLAQPITPGVRALPLYGCIAAGSPIEAVSNPDTLQVPDFLLPGRGDYYVLRVKGDSMIEEHISDGDYVVIESKTTARPGDTVVALIDDESVTLKKFFPEGKSIRLQPANASLTPILVEASRVKIQGIVVSIMRKYQ